MKGEDLIFEINMIIAENVFPNKRMQAVKEMVDQLITENQELRENYEELQQFAEDDDKRITKLVIKTNQLEKQLEEQKELVEFWNAYKLAYKHCYHVLLLDDKNPMVYHSVTGKKRNLLEWYREQKGE